MIFKDGKVYDILKLVALIALPVGTFISTFCGVWGIPYGEQIMQTFAALDVLVGALVTASKFAYDNRESNGLE